MKSHINFGEDTEGDITFHEIQGFDIKCKKCGHGSVEIMPTFWYGGGEEDGAEIVFRCNKCDIKETIEDR